MFDLDVSLWFLRFAFWAALIVGLGAAMIAFPPLALIGAVAALLLMIGAMPPSQNAGDAA